MKTNYSKFTAGLITAWFVLALAASALHLFQGPPGRPPLGILLAVLIPIAVFSGWYLRSGTFRTWVLSLDPQALTRLHAWRVVGFSFVVLYAYDLLPGMFALPAGWGDVAIGLTAYSAAALVKAPNQRNKFIVWHLLGVLDLVLAIFLGAASGFIHPHGINAGPMTLLPLSLIPGFGVPFFLILHTISFAQTRRSPAGNHQRIAGPASAAV